MKTHNAGFDVFQGPCGRPLRTYGIFIQNRFCECVATIVGRQAPLLFLLALALSLACPRTLPAQASDSYRINTKESKIEILLYRGGLLSAFGDNHLINLTHFSGKVNLSHMDGWNAVLSGDAASLKVIDPWGSPAERKEVEDTMLGPTQLDVKNFPSIKLRSVSFDPTAQDTAWRLWAEVELHGVTRKIQFSLDCHQIGEKLQIQGKRMFKLTDFNIQPFSAAFGAVKIKNDFEVTYNIVLDRVH